MLFANLWDQKQRWNLRNPIYTLLTMRTPIWWLVVFRRKQYHSEIFSSFFTNEPEGTWEFLDKSEIRHCLNINITEDKLFMKFQKLKISISPDGVHPRVLNELQFAIVKPLTMILCTSVSNSTLPQAWKEANISAIFKEECKHFSGNGLSV